jgi:hypothetical protein
VRSIRLRIQIDDRLVMEWSPEQITGRMELEGCLVSVFTMAL